MIEDKYASKLVVIRSYDKIAGGVTDFTVALGDTLAYGNARSCYIKFIDAAIETSYASGTQAIAPVFNSKDLYFVCAGLGQTSVDTGGRGDILGYVKVNRTGVGNSGSSAGAVSQALTPNDVYTEAPVPRGNVNFKILDPDFNSIATTNLDSVTIILQIFYKE